MEAWEELRGHRVRSSLLGLKELSQDLFIVLGAVWHYDLELLVNFGCVEVAHTIAIYGLEETERLAVCHGWTIEGGDTHAAKPELRGLERAEHCCHRSGLVLHVTQHRGKMRVGPSRKKQAPT